MRVKYCEQRLRSDGSTIWVINPKKKIKDATGLGFRGFDSLEEARAYSDQISREYDLWRRKQARQVYIQPGTVDELMSIYRGSPAFRDRLKENSRKSYLHMMEVASETYLGSANIPFGQYVARTVTPMHADKLYATIREQRSEHMAFHAMKVMRLVWEQAKRYGFVPNDGNPFSKMRTKSLKGRSTLWEQEQVHALIEVCDARDHRNLGTLILCCYHLCQRPGDMRQLIWANWDGGVFDFTQEKTGVRLELPASPEILARLPEEGLPGAVILPNDRTGRPHDRFSYYKQARKIMDEIGLPQDLQIRDLRRTGATELARNGCTEDELRAVTGHQSRGVLNDYVRPERRLSTSAMARRFK